MKLIKCNTNKLGELHSDNDKPAIEWDDGTKEWYKNDLRHRDNKPAIVYKNGDTYWYFDGKLHRDDGPAIELNNGYKFWYKNGVMHRDDGPAVEGRSGTSDVHEYYLNGKHYKTKEKYLKDLDKLHIDKSKTKLK